MVAGPESAVMQKLRDAVGAFVHRLVGDALIGAGDDDGGLVGPRMGVCAGIIHGIGCFVCGTAAVAAEIYHSASGRLKAMPCCRRRRGAIVDGN